MNILINDKNSLKELVRLNTVWIEEHFSIEEVDKRLAENPEQIIEKGGYTIALEIENEIIGVCALFKEENNTFELARMAVDKRFQGKGYGQILIEEAFRLADEIKAKRLTLLSNQKLVAAISLYKKNGFETVQTGSHPIYSRCDIIMEKIL